MISPSFRPLTLACVTAFLLACGSAPTGAQASTVTTLYSFTGGDGEYPRTGLVQGSDGNFYGTSEYGGRNNWGTVYKITPGGTLTVLHVFDFSDGSNPAAALVQGSDGNFYGTTSGGGANGNGTVFQITPTGALTVLYNFSARTSGNINADGYNPEAAVVQGSDGDFYGTTHDGGANGNGTIFQITPAGTLTTLHNFSAESGGRNSDGGNPLGALVQGSDGDFYGTTSSAGANSTGTVFKITPGRVLTTLHSFTYTDGAYPYAGLVQGPEGNFYGTTYEGGADRYGTVFSITSAGVLTIVHNFNVSDGAYPEAALILGQDGTFYGTTSSSANYTGGFGAGSAFRITSSGALTHLYTFNGSTGTGSFSVGGLIQASDGNFYGTTYEGGTDDYGTVYRLTLTDELQFTTPTALVKETAKDVVFEVSRTSEYLGGTAVQYSTADGTALAGRDYVAASNTLIWAAGDTSAKYVVIDLLNPGVEYPNAKRRFTVNLSAPTNGATVGTNGSATVALIGTTELPVITSADTASGEVGAPFSYQITATYHPKSYRVLGLPKGLTVNSKTGLISGKPAGAGTHTLTLEASNQGGEGSASLTLTVGLQAPVITSPAMAAAAFDAASFYQITATGNPGRYAVDGLGAGLTVNPETGLISGKPEGVGTFTLTLHAFNPQGEGTQTLMLTIVRVPPVITSPTTATGTVNQPFSYQITADGAPSQYHVIKLPTGLSVNAATGLISGTPTHAGTPSLTLEAYNGQGEGTAVLALTILSD